MRGPAYAMSRLPSAFRSSSVNPSGYVPGQWLATYLGGVASGNPLQVALGESERQAIHPDTGGAPPAAPPQTIPESQQPEPGYSQSFGAPNVPQAPSDQGVPQAQPQPQSYDTGMTTDMLPMLTTAAPPSRAPLIIGGILAVAAIGTIVYFVSKRR